MIGVLSVLYSSNFEYISLVAVVGFDVWWNILTIAALGTVCDEGIFLVFVAVCYSAGCVQRVVAIGAGIGEYD